MTSTRPAITFKGEPIEVTGTELKVGDRLPEFQLTGTDMSDITNSTFSGKTLIISAVPSLDTPVCSMQTRRFNLEASKADANLTVLTVSRDLPFAQKRWCGAEGASAVITASDYKYRTFGQTFGLEIPALALLARAVFVVDNKNTIRYIEYVPEIAQEPNYTAALSAAQSC